MHIATLFAIQGSIPADRQSACAKELDQLRSRAAGLFASVSSDSGEQQILIIGDSEHAVALEQILTTYGLACVTKRNCPEFISAEGEIDECAIFCRLGSKLPPPPDIYVDYPDWRRCN